MNTLRISDLVFSVRAATFMGHMTSGQLGWSISIETDPEEVEGEQWQPRAYSERLLAVDGLIVKHWADVIRAPITWEDCYDVNTGQNNAALYVFEHGDIYASRLKITPLSKDRITIEWNALCNVWFGDYSEGLKLAISTEGDFRGVSVGAYNEALTATEADERLRKFITDDTFQFEPPCETHADPIMRPV